MRGFAARLNPSQGPHHPQARNALLSHTSLPTLPRALRHWWMSSGPLSSSASALRFSGCASEAASTAFRESIAACGERGAPLWRLRGKAGKRERFDRALCFRPLGRPFPRPRYLPYDAAVEGPQRAASNRNAIRGWQSAGAPASSPPRRSRSVWAKKVGREHSFPGRRLAVVAPDCAMQQHWAVIRKLVHHE